jgi:hypothetical protein
MSRSGVGVRYAWQPDDINGVVALLSGAARLQTSPSPLEYQGQNAIGTFPRELASWRSGNRFKRIPMRANTQPAFAT